MDQTTKILIGFTISILITVIAIPFLVIPFVNMGILFLLVYYFYIPLYNLIAEKNGMP